MQGAICTENDFLTKRSEFDAIWLLKIIKKRLSGVYKDQNPYMAIRDSLMSLLTIKQYDTESNSTLFDRFESRKEAFMLIAGKNMPCSEKTLKKDVSATSEAEIDTEIEKFWKCVCCARQIIKNLEI